MEVGGVIIGRRWQIWWMVTAGNAMEEGTVKSLGRVQDKNSRGNQAPVGRVWWCRKRSWSWSWAPYWVLRFTLWSNLCLHLQWFQRQQLHQHIYQLGLWNQWWLNWGFNGYKVFHWKVSCCHREQDWHGFSYEICAQKISFGSMPLLQHLHHIQCRLFS